jgi:glutaconyl-CoA/methylmalonyl-CoA decarboxylase subunit delta
MMKKFLSAVCIVFCLLSLSACGNQKDTASQVTSQHEESAKSLANSMTAFLVTFFDETQAAAIKSEHNAESLELLFDENYQVYVNGNGVLKAVDSFQSAYDDFGKLVTIDEITSTVNGEYIYVYLQVTGEKKTGEIEYIFSNDYFVSLESATLNVDYTLPEKMKAAALNTVIGLTVVFSVLILISFIISTFTLFGKDKHNNHTTKTLELRNVIEPMRVPYSETKDAVEPFEEDLELVAVITAAIMTHREKENVQDTAFVVRSIRKAR